MRWGEVRWDIDGVGRDRMGSGWGGMGWGVISHAHLSIKLSNAQWAALNCAA